jgi:uncharacterized protein (DUF608 family)
MNESLPVYKHERILASGIPLGGLGTGSVEIRPDGRFHDWEIFNNYSFSGSTTLDQPEMWSEDAFFALRVAHQGKKPKVRLLYDDDKQAPAAASRHLYNPIYTFPFLRNVKRISYESRFPFARLNYQDNVDIDVQMEAFSPFVPMDAKNSALPAAYFVFTLTNTADVPCQASVAFSLRNCAGYDLDEHNHRHCAIDAPWGRGVLMTDDAMDPHHVTAGTMVAAAMDPQADRCLAWTDDRGLYGFENADVPGFGEVFLKYRDTGKMPDLVKSPWRRKVTHSNVTPTNKMLGRFHSPCKHWRGGVSIQADLEPGQSRQMVFLMAWHFPNLYHYYDQSHMGHMYENWFEDAGQVAQYAAENFQDLQARSRRFVDELYQGLPASLADSLNAQLTTFPQSFWWTRTGEMACWEGMACCQILPNAWPMWSTFQPLMFFPEVYTQMKDRMALFDPENQQHRSESPFLASERDRRTAFNQDRQKRNDLGGWYTQRYQKLGYPAEEFASRPHRGQSDRPFAGYVLSAVQIARDLLWTGDESFLRDNWEAIRRRLTGLMEQDENGDGLPDGLVSWMTYDHWFVPALNCYKSTLSLADCRAGAFLAGIMEDCDLAEQLEKFVAKGSASMERILFNGEYYSLCYDPLKDEIDPGCMADQVSGQLYTRLCGLEAIHDVQHVQSALKAVLKYNRSEEEGLLNGSDPKGREDWRYFSRYSQQGEDEQYGGQWTTPWTGTEYFVAATMAAEGLVEEALQVVEDVWDRHVDFGMLYNHIECGEHYFRPMVLWAILPALQGLVYDARTGRLEMNPKYSPDHCDTLLLLPGAWGRLAQHRPTGEQVNTITLCDGKLELSEICVPGGRGNVRITLDGQRLEASTRDADGVCSVQPARKLTLQAGNVLKIEQI